MSLYFAVISFFLLIPFHAYASEPLSLKEAISIAIAKNNHVKAAGYRAEAAVSGVRLAGSGYYPAIALEERFAASNAPTQTFMMKLDQGRFTQNDFQIGTLNQPPVTYDFKTTLSVQQPLYLPSLSPLKEMAVKDAERGRLELEAARQEVAFQVFRLYLELKKSEARVKVADMAIDEARESMRLASVRRASGVGLFSDELQARTRLSEVEQQLITAQNNRMLTRMQLAMLLGQNEGRAYDTSALPERIAVPHLDEELAGTALLNRADMKLSRLDVEKSESAVTLARSGYYPSAGIFASFQLNGRDAPFTADNDGWVAGINLKWQLFDGFRSGHERSRASAERLAAVEIMEGRSRDIRYQLKESYLRRDETGKRLEVARHALLDAEEAARLITRRFENSLSTMLELLDAQNSLNQARANMVETETGYLLASGRVYHAAGIFLKEILK